MCNNSLYKKRNLEKETSPEEAPIGKLDMKLNKFAPLADLGEYDDKSEKEPIRKLLFQQNKWNNSHVSQSDSYTFTSQMGENRRRKSDHQNANTSARQLDRQNKFASLNSEDPSTNSGNFSHYQEQPPMKEQNVPRTDHRKPDKTNYSEASEALQSLIQSCSSSMKKFFKENNQNNNSDHKNKLDTTSKITRATRNKVNQKVPNKTKARRTELKNSSNHLTKFLVVTKNQKETHSLDNRITTAPPNNEQQLIKPVHLHQIM
ncbi:Hypothetical_protein [Hexamita inflata]|uniref:Hypothetical_protein n=1 Tax=Hexamita inflata TaxID=28002 RepID=A0AA86QM63_9EUKA|nr:Hypothetical protein HINF_LOCUS43299 [Hexamita inflata]